MSEQISPAEWIARAYAKSGIPIKQARDLVILRCLQAGDASVFSYFVLADHQPGLEVLRTMAFMTATAAPDEIVSCLPFGLEAARRTPSKAGKRIDPLVAMRDELIALNADAEKTGPGMYDSAIAIVHERVHRSISKKTIRNAYDHLIARQGN